MKVRCIKLLDSRGRELASSTWLKIGGIYQVLTLSIDASGKDLIRLVGEQEPEPVLHPLQQFEVVDNRIPRNWVVTVRPSAGIVIGPEPWMAPGFWERFFDGDAHARAIFEAERLKIVDEGCEKS